MNHYYRYLLSDEWRVHVGIGLVRAQMGLERWNADRTDVPEELLKKAEASKAAKAKEAEAKEEPKTEEAVDIEEPKKKRGRPKKSEEEPSEE